MLALCLAACGWFIWWYLFGSLPTTRTVKVDPQQVRQETVRGALRQAANFRGIRISGNGEWTVYCTAGTILIRKEKNDYRVRPFYYLAMLLTPTERQLAIAHQRLRSDEAMARQVGLTKEQVQQLRKLQPPAMKLSDADQQNLKTLWIVYVQAGAGAPQQAAEKALLAAYDDVARASLEPSTQAARALIVELKPIITDEMVAKVNGTSGTAKAAAK